MSKYSSLQDIDDAFPVPENESNKDKNQRLSKIRQAKKRFCDAQKTREDDGPSNRTRLQIAETSPPSFRTRSQTTANATLRRQISRIAQTTEQRKSVKEKDVIRHFTKQKQSKE
jgi:putative cell wall-binding protein